MVMICDESYTPNRRQDRAGAAEGEGRGGSGGRRSRQAEEEAFGAPLPPVHFPSMMMLLDLWKDNKSVTERLYRSINAREYSLRLACLKSKVKMNVLRRFAFASYELTKVSFLEYDDDLLV